VTGDPIPITVEKAKWDGSVSARWPALLLPARAPVLMWRTAAGTAIARPRKETVERAEHDMVSVTAGGCWVATALLGPDGRPASYEVDACAPVEPVRDGLLRYVDLDLDLEIDDAEIRLLDQEQFRRRAVEMGYPDDVRECAWAALRDAAERYGARRWPFDGELSPDPGP
jgi:protein associated with RNAse G/E